MRATDPMEIDHDAHHRHAEYQRDKEGSAPPEMEAPTRYFRHKLRFVKMETGIERMPQLLSNLLRVVEKARIVFSDQCTTEAQVLKHRHS